MPTLRNAEDAATAAAEAYIKANGVGDPRLLARAVLAAVAVYQAGSK